MDERFHVEFEASVDDVADAGLRYLRSSEAGRAVKRKEILRSTVISAAALFVVAMWAAGWPSWTAAAFVASLAVLWGVLFRWGYARVYDRYVLRRLRTFAQEQLGSADRFHCACELREDALWSATNGTEVLFPWRDATAIREAEGGIEMDFRGGSMLVRDRAFTSASDRAAFLQRARQLASR